MGLDDVQVNKPSGVITKVITLACVSPEAEGDVLQRVECGQKVE